MKLLVLVDLVVLAAALAIWLVVRDDDQTNVVNGDLRGSKPPGGQVMPDLRDIPSIVPAPAAPAQYRGAPVVLFATCMDCRSGDIFGGYLGRLREGDVPEGARAVVVAWGGDVEAWRNEWGIRADGGPAALDVHAVTSADGANGIRSTLGIGERDGQEESGMAFLYDASGTWRATYFLGQLDRDDIRHDLAQLGQG